MAEEKEVFRQFVEKSDQQSDDKFSFSNNQNDGKSMTVWLRTLKLPGAVINNNKL